MMAELIDFNHFHIPDAIFNGGTFKFDTNVVVSANFDISSGFY